MKFSCAMLVPALVVALTFVTTSHCDEGFIDDFFSRFPHLPFHQVHPESGDPGNDAYYKTLYTMHKNRRGPGKTEDPWRSWLRIPEPTVPCTKAIELFALDNKL